MNSTHVTAPSLRSGEAISDAPDVAGEDTRAFTEIASDIVQKAETLMRQELKLVVADAEDRLRLFERELSERADRLKVEMIAKVTGGVVVFVGALALTSAVILLLALAIDPWLAALIVGVVLCVVGAVLLKRSSRPLPPLRPHDLVPSRAVESAKKDIHAIEEAVHD